MIRYVLLLWILIHLSAPAWCYVLLGVGVFIIVLKWWVNLDD